MRVLLLLGLTAAAVTWCAAGVTYTAVSHGGKSEGVVKVVGWVSGNNARVDFVQSPDPGLREGSYLISRDGGKSVVLVDPSQKTFTRWDLQQAMSNMAGMMQGMRGLMKVKFENPQVEKLLEEDGGQVAGMATRHYRYRTSYTMTMELAGSHAITTVVQEDIWSAPKLVNTALGLWLKKEPLKTGDEQLDQMIRTEMGKVEGFPLKRVTVTTNTDEAGKVHSNRSEMEVTEFKNVAVPASKFVVPKSYSEAPSDSRGVDWKKMQEEMEKNKQKPPSNPL